MSRKRQTAPTAPRPGHGVERPRPEPTGVHGERNGRFSGFGTVRAAATRRLQRRHEEPGSACAGPTRLGVRPRASSADIQASFHQGRLHIPTNFKTSGRVAKRASNRLASLPPPPLRDASPHLSLPEVSIYVREAPIVKIDMFKHGEEPYHTSYLRRSQPHEDEVERRGP